MGLGSYIPTRDALVRQRALVPTGDVLARSRALIQYEI